MTEPLRVLICDNDLDRVADWENRVRACLSGAAAEVKSLTPADFGRAVKALNDRVLSAKSGESSEGDGADEIDNADVLVLDSDLTPDPDSQSGADPHGYVEKYLVGEVGQTVARLARAHSRVGSIVVVNQSVKRRTFDLTMTRWRSGWADVYITHDDVDNPGLWLGEGDQPYRPWSWPVLSRTSTSVRAFLETVSLNSSVLESLELADGVGSALSFRQLESLSSDIGDPLALTYRDVALSPVLGIGSQPKDDEADSQLLSVGVWGVRRWLDRIVVPTQSVLTDLPHLLQDRPWHLPNRSAPSEWIDRTKLWNPDKPLPLASAINTPASSLLGYPVWVVSDLPSESSASNRVSKEDPVFCEDSSEFSAVEEASDFESDLEGPFSTRYVRRLSDVDYTPRHRLFQ